MAFVGFRPWAKRAEARVGEPVEAACGVVPRSSRAAAFGRALSSDEAAPVWWLVLTESELLLFETRRAGFTLRPHPGREVLRVPLRTVSRVVYERSRTTSAFRLEFADGADLALGAVRIHRGEAVVDRLAQLVADARRSSA